VSHAGWRHRGLPRERHVRWPTFRGAKATRITERKGPTLPNPLAAPEDVGSRPDVRLWVVGGVFVLLFALMGVRLAFLQIVQHTQYVEAVASNSLRTATVPAPRGEVVDRSFNVLVANSVHQELVMSRAEASTDPAMIGRAAALAGVTPNSIARALTSNKYSPYEPVPILADTPTSVIIYLEEHAAEFPGLSVQTVTERKYPAGGALAPHLLGYTGAITSSEWADGDFKSKGYSESAIIGQSGIESYYDNYLRGVDGVKKILVNAVGVPIATESNVPPTVGDTIQLNLDTKLQAFVTNALSEGIQRVRATKDPRSGVYPPAVDGAVVVLDPRNGHVLAMASYPSYSLNEWVGGISKPNYKALQTSKALNNYAVSGQFTPGSTFKLITATAALDDHLISPYQYVDDTGAFTVPGCLQGASGCTFHDDETSGLGEVDLPLALTESSDYYFYNLGYLFWSQHVNLGSAYRYGATPIQDIATAYGLNGPTGVDLPNEASSIVDSPLVHYNEHKQYPKLYPNGGWYTGDNIEMAFGQGGTSLTPLGLADAYATFANGGTRYIPEVAAAVYTPGGHLLLRYQPREAGRVPLPASTRNPILQGLLGVVNNPSGTGYGAFHSYATFNLNSFPIAGKTGTATVYQGTTKLEPNSWFVAFGPAYSPRYVVLCVIGQGGYGADAAAPVVAQTFSYLVSHPVGSLVVPRQHTGTHHHQ
jgi:penicillin-binding protein 2